MAFMTLSLPIYSDLLLNNIAWIYETKKIFSNTVCLCYFAKEGWVLLSKSFSAQKCKVASKIAWWHYNFAKVVELGLYSSRNGSIHKILFHLLAKTHYWLWVTVAKKCLTKHWKISAFLLRSLKCFCKKKIKSLLAILCWI